MTTYEDRLTIATPEGVDLDLTLAGLGSRFIAGAIDLVLKLVLIGLLALALLGAGDLGIAAFLPAMALVLLAYDMLFELLAQGRTPGKRWTGLRVVRDDGSPVDVRGSAIRNILRLVDGWPLSYAPTIVSVLVTKRNQRLGDLAAGTVVARDRRVADAGPVAAPGPTSDGTAPAWDVSAVGAEDLAALRSFLERRHGLEPAVRRRVATRLADALRGRVGGAPELEPEPFLEGVVAAKLASEAQAV